MSKTPYGHMTIDEMLAAYPNGFAVAPSGVIYQIIMASSHLPLIAQAHPLPPPDGGYYVVREADMQEKQVPPLQDQT